MASQPQSFVVTCLLLYDFNLRIEPGASHFTHKDGQPY